MQMHLQPGPPLSLPLPVGAQAHPGVPVPVGAQPGTMGPLSPSHVQAVVDAADAITVRVNPQVGVCPRNSVGRPRELSRPNRHREWIYGCPQRKLTWQARCTLG